MRINISGVLKFARSMMRHTILVVIAGMTLLAIILRFLVLQQFNKALAEDLQEHQQFAQVSADLVDYVIESNLSVLQAASHSIHWGEGRPDQPWIKRALHDASTGSIYSEGVFLMGADGKVLAMEPHGPSKTVMDPSLFSLLQKDHLFLKPEVSNLILHGGKRILMTVPIRDSHGKLLGIIGGELDPESGRFRSLFHPTRIEDSMVVEIVDQNGLVLASSNPRNLFKKIDHAPVLTRLLGERKSLSADCASCHQGSDLRAKRNGVISFVPLSTAPWAVKIRRNEVGGLFIGFLHEWKFLSAGGITILAVIVIAWRLDRRTTRRLNLLASAADQIAAGRYHEPIPPMGEDEIGRFAQACERARAGLQNSLSEISEKKHDSQRRVLERTRELVNLTSQFQNISREIQDEVGRMLDAILLSIQTESGSSPEVIKEQIAEIKRRLDQMVETTRRLGPIGDAEGRSVPSLESAGLGAARIRVFIAEAQALLRDGVRALLGGADDIGVIGEASDSTGTITQVMAKNPDIVLLDSGLPGIGALETALELKKAVPGTRILLLTHIGEGGYLQRYRKVGVAGYVLIGSLGTDLLSAIRVVYQGGTYLRGEDVLPALEGGLDGAEFGASKDPYDSLTDRERQVLKLVAEGKTSREIAAILQISVKTAMGHRANLMEKLNSHNSAELVRFALLRGITH